MKNCVLVVALTLALVGCSMQTEEKRAGTLDTQQASGSIRAEEMLKHIKALSSDEFEGRAPGSRGEELTVQYLSSQFRSMGLRPGNPDGTFVQKVPLVGIKGEPQAAFSSAQKRIDLRFPTDYVAVSRHAQPEVNVLGSDIVFVGYGVVAPEYGWDDYKDVDVKGKTLLMLINDPAIPDPADPAKLDERMFKGRAMTYYGRWTYKYEIASQKGAAAAILIHETGPAGYPYEVVSSSWGGENFDINKPGANDNRVKVESWISLDTANRLCTLAGKDLGALKKAALDKAFRPVPFDVRADFRLKNTTREINSQNVIARLDGGDPKLRDEYVIYTAHWDHLGKDAALQGDQIFNGAVDNASGVSALLELAQAFSTLKPPPRRSVLFLAVTAEEQGLLGAKYYAESPLYPLAKTAANINIDGMFLWGRTRDVTAIGLGNSTLDDVLQEAVRTQGRVVRPDPEPEKGFFYRSDHFEFAKQGVPALYVDTGTEFVGKAADFGSRKRDEYTSNDYHNVSDEVKPDWDLSGIVEDVRLLFDVGVRVAQSDAMPEWKPGTEFKAKRESMLRDAAAGK
jgi:Zn-dependent M28 family amino/carboxypeptidase